MPYWDKTIDLIILNYEYSLDPYIWLFELLDNYVVENILWSELVGTAQKAKSGKELVRDRGLT